MDYRRTLKLSFYCVLGPLVAGAVVGGALRETRPAANATPTESDVTTATTDSTKQDSAIVLLVLTKSTCGACTSPAFRTAIRSVVQLYRLQTSSSGRKLHVHGVAADTDVAKAISFLSGLGTFDEVSVGRGWLNSSSYGAFWSNRKASPTVPQLLVIHETVQVGSFGVQILKSDTVLRLEGLDAIERESRAVRSIADSADLQSAPAKLPDLPRGNN
jgi:hypothetical protein